MYLEVKHTTREHLNFERLITMENTTVQTTKQPTFFTFRPEVYKKASLKPRKARVESDFMKTLREMQVNQAFFVPASAGEAATDVQALWRSRTHSFAKKNPEYSFSVRQNFENGADGKWGVLVIRVPVKSKTASEASEESTEESLSATN